MFKRSGEPITNGSPRVGAFFTGMIDQAGDYPIGIQQLDSVDDHFMEHHHDCKVCADNISI